MVKDFIKKKKQCVALNIRNLEISSKQRADLKKKCYSNYLLNK